MPKICSIFKKKPCSGLSRLSKKPIQRPKPEPIIRERRRVFVAVEKTVNRIKLNKIKNIIILDKSARAIYIGILEYYRIKYPNEKPPRIYFLNPNSFKHNDHFTAQAVREFANRYKRLMKERSDPVLVLDNCMHYGTTMNATYKLLMTLNFKKIDNFVLFQDGHATPGCYTIGDRQQSLVANVVTTSIVSKKDSYTDVKAGIQIRNEIKDIVRENLS